MNVLFDWLGSGGKPVPKEHAEKRSLSCIRCPYNTAGTWWTRMIKDPIAEAIKEQLQVKHEMDLHVSTEESLFMCRACGCCTRLKNWVPLKHIVEHTPEDVMKSFPPYCWIKLELAEQTKES